jgi:hypothetical protein
MAVVLFAFSSCLPQDSEQMVDKGISQDVLKQIEHLGFSTENVAKLDDGYLVEGDILLTEEDLQGDAHRMELVIAQEEQYHTFNLVTGLPRVIKVRTTSTNAKLSQAIDAAIARYNAENLSLTFLRVTTTDQDILIQEVNTNQFIASAGFPSGGNPFGSISYSRRYLGNSYSLNFVTTVVAHEMGHCIGFRHTDYMNRSYSCGTGGNEGAGTVGAVHIPGTPTGPDPNSWMLACLSATTNRPFNANDKVALDYLY